MKKKVFLKAWAIYRELKTEKFSDCLRFAWCAVLKGLESFKAFNKNERQDFRGVTHVDYSATVGGTTYYTGSVYALFYKVANHKEQNNDAAAYTYGVGAYCGD